MRDKELIEKYQKVFLEDFQMTIDHINSLAEMPDVIKDSLPNERCINSFRYNMVQAIEWLKPDLIKKFVQNYEFNIDFQGGFVLNLYNGNKTIIARMNNDDNLSKIHYIDKKKENKLYYFTDQCLCSCLEEFFKE